MKKLLTILLCVLISTHALTQDRKLTHNKALIPTKLPNLKDCMHTAQQNLSLYLTGQPNDVNSIIKDIELYIDSTKTRTYLDVLLNKYFYPLRTFFLTTTNKTSVAAEFLYDSTPYSFCMYGDTALTLYLGAVKDKDSYNLSKTTDKRIAQLALANCLLPSLAALDSFTGSEIKYVALSIYYGCKDPRDGAPPVAATPYCLILVARMADVRQYSTGLLTDKGLLANSELYLGDADEMRSLNHDSHD